MKWPGVIEPDTQTSEIATNVDWFPTLAKLAGGEIPKNIDGHSLLDIFTNSGTSKHEFLPYFCGTELMAGRIGNYKVYWMTPNFIDQSERPTNSTQCSGTGECCPKTCTNGIDLGCMPEASCKCDRGSVFTSSWGPEKGKF